MHPTTGRPRSTAADEAIRTATLELLAEGPEAVTFEGVALRAGVAKTTVYRRYRTRGELLFRTLLHDRPRPAPDTGSLRGDVRALLEGFTAVFRSDAGRRGVFGIIDALERDEDFRDGYIAGFMQAEHAVADAVVRAAVARGELSRPLAAARVRAIVIGPALIHCALYRDRPAPALLDELTEEALGALRAAAQRGPDPVGA